MQISIVHRRVGNVVSVSLLLVPLEEVVWIGVWRFRHYQSHPFCWFGFWEHFDIFQIYACQRDLRVPLVRHKTHCERASCYLGRVTGFEGRMLEQRLETKCLTALAKPVWQHL